MCYSEYKQDGRPLRKIATRSSSGGEIMFTSKPTPIGLLLTDPH